MNLKLLRLKSGEDIICDVTRESAEYIYISDPAMLMPVSHGGHNQVQMGLAP